MSLGLYLRWKVTDSILMSNTKPPDWHAQFSTAGFTVDMNENNIFIIIQIARVQTIVKYDYLKDVISAASFLAL